MTYGMATYRALPPVLGQVNPRFAAPAIATVAGGVILIAAIWAYLLSTSIANVFTQVIDVTGLLFASFYILTALAAMTYYRRRILSNLWDAVLVGILLSPQPASWYGSWPNHFRTRLPHRDGH
jgi:amino acid transporter